MATAYAEKWSCMIAYSNVCTHSTLGYCNGSTIWKVLLEEVSEKNNLQSENVLTV